MINFSVFIWDVLKMYTHINIVKMGLIGGF